MSATTTPATVTTTALRCAEVWGGNHAVETDLTLPGLVGAVLSRPYHNGQDGGDVHLVSSCGTGRITRLMLADVAGHGQQVADLGHRLRGVMQRYMNHIDPQRLASRLNHDMAQLSGSSGRFATAIILTYFAPDGGLSLCNAGHPLPMLYRARRNAWVIIDQPDPGEAVENLPLGVLEDAGYHGRDLTLDPGDLLLAYTDCLTEATHPTHGQLGTQRLLDTLNRLNITAETPPAAVVKLLLARLAADGFTLDDDLTTVALRCTGRSEGAGFRDKLDATARTLRGAIIGSAAFPWPELSWLNLGGALLPGVKRGRKASAREG